MNTAALKRFAPAVRQQLLQAVDRQLAFVLAARTPDYLTTFAPQVAALRQLALADRAGLVERVAYTWFNRLTALRYLDAHDGWHPFRARVLMPASAAETQPALLKLLRAGALPPELAAHTNLARLNDLLDGRIPSNDAQGEVYRQLVLATCRFYQALLPDVFELLDDATELLLPDDLLTEQSVAHGFRTEIADADCADVEIIGWLYQFYISERKDQVMARKSAVPTEDIPAVTQLFTPHWIVRYLVENSLGRLWLLNRPGSRLREHMPYYIEGEKNATGGSPDDFLKITKPEEIRLCDPAVGSGHMLTYAFDLLTLIYEEEGYAPTEIPALILRHNLHGLEICPRAAQLAELALVFKAREKSRRFFQPEHLVRPRIIELRDVRFAENELRDYIRALGLGDLFSQPMLQLLHQFEEAKNFGSLIQPCLDERAIADVRRAIEAKDLGGQLFLRETHLKVLRVLEQAEALTQRYHVVVANPPYMGSRQMNGRLRVFADENFPKSEVEKRSLELLNIVQIRRPETVLKQYQHELSGGMKQRVMIACAIAQQPELIVADEPTTGLDVTVQAEIMELLKQIRKDFNTSIILVSHDLPLINEICDDIVVMHAGTTVEKIPSKSIKSSKHPYTIALYNSRIDLVEPKGQLKTINGQPPSVGNWPAGCRFSERCDFVKDKCRVKQDLPLIKVGSNHQSSCLRYDEIAR